MTEWNGSHRNTKLGDKGESEMSDDELDGKFWTLWFKYHGFRILGLAVWIMYPFFITGLMVVHLHLKGVL